MKFEGIKELPANHYTLCVNTNSVITQFTQIYGKAPSESR